MSGTTTVQTVSTGTGNVATFSNVAAGNYTISATSGACSGTGSVSVTTGGGTSCTTPTIISTSSAGTAGTVTWGSTGATSYTVQYRVAGSGSSYTTVSPNPTGTSVTITGLTAGLNYEVQVAGNCAGGTTSSFSATAVISSCGPPTNVQFSNITTSSVDVSWTEAPNATSYTLSYRLNSTDVWTNITTSGTSRTITGLQAGRTYLFRIRSRCGTSFGLWSSDIPYNMNYNFTTPAARMAASESVNDEALSVYPNPNKGTFTATFDAMFDGDANLVITDVAGKVIYNTNVSVITGRNDIPVDISRFATGMYLLQFKAASTHTVKIVVQ
jgi:hypothetical protein